jgi:hypothetical protein
VIVGNGLTMRAKCRAGRLVQLVVLELVALMGPHNSRATAATQQTHLIPDPTSHAAVVVQVLSVFALPQLTAAAAY